ncbi:MAG TPA: hypothetical protein VGO93_14930 [Candidatus Xenobia bacterium]|jgi:hypothetical protein
MVIPFARSYWVVPGRLLAGCIPASREPEMRQQNLEGLLRVGIRSVINLTEPGESNTVGVALPDYRAEWEALAGPVPVEYHELGFKDGTAPDDELMERILMTIDRSLDQGRPVYVHCWGGRGRTGTVIGAGWRGTGWRPGSSRWRWYSICDEPIPRRRKHHLRQPSRLAWCGAGGAWR